MKPKDRVITTLEHREPDRVPLDGLFRYETVKALEKHFGVADDIALKRKLGTDFCYVKMNASEEFRRKIDRSLNAVVRTDAVKLSDGTYQDEWGTKYRLGATGDFWHIAENPLQNTDAFEEYEFPYINAPGRFDEATKIVERCGDDFAIAAMEGHAFLSSGWLLRGFRPFIYDLYTNPGFANKLLDKMLIFKIEEGRRFVEMGVDIIFLADDLGSEKNMLVNPDVWRRYFKPRMQKFIQALKKKGQVHILFHSDGYIEPVIPDLIEIGVEILNPIQPECMDPAEIKKKYGDKLALHGTVSVQKTLPFGTIDDVKREVKERIKTCSPGGGFILAPANFITPDIPMENVLAVYETAKKYGKYNK